MQGRAVGCRAREADRLSEQAFSGSPARAPAPTAGWARAGPVTRAEKALPIGLAATALVATGGAVFVTAVSRHAPHSVLHEVLTVVVCLSFVGAGLVALRHRPYARFGLLLAAVGFSTLLGALHDANGAVPYTIGVLTSNLVFAALAHALLAFPKGRLLSRRNRVLAVAAYIDVVVVQAIAVLFDPLTRWNSAHPSNLALADAHASLATALEEVEAAAALALALGVAIVLVNRARAETPAARRQLVPVLYGGSGALLVFAIGLALAPLSSDAAVAGIGVGMVASLALPAAFLGVILQGRLSRAAVGELLVELREGAELPSLPDALRRALGDPSLEVGHREGRERYVDAVGRELESPGPESSRVVTPIRHQGSQIGVLLHDRSLRLRPELLEAVGAAAGFALANERALATVQRVEARNRALLDVLPDLMIRVARDGTYLDVRAEDPSQLLYPAEELVGRNVRDVLPHDLAERVLACIERALAGGTMCAIEYEIEIAGVPRWKESRMVPSGDGEVVTIVRDFTDQRRAQAELRRLVGEQAALRRVATLVAEGAVPERVFQAVTGEVCRLLGLRSAMLLRYEEEEKGTVVGRFGEPSDDFEVGSVLELAEGAALTVLRTGEPARVDYRYLPGELAARMRRLDFRSGVAVPISVAGTTWGALIVGLREGERLLRQTERRLEAFAGLVALALASAQARDELAGSRLRIIEASDDERRRIERNLHDGAQQRLVALAVGLRLVQARIHDAPHEAEEMIADASEELRQALAELRDLAQGIHPAVLTDRGLTEALDVLAARTPLPVLLDVELAESLPPPVEAAAYYVVSEALANVVKHASAAAARVRVESTNGSARIEVSDDGNGGADPATGSGLRGLRDRVETLAGRLEVESRPGLGTLIRAEVPLR